MLSRCPCEISKTAWFASVWVSAMQSYFSLYTPSRGLIVVQSIHFKTVIFNTRTWPHIWPHTRHVRTASIPQPISVYACLSVCLSKYRQSLLYSSQILPAVADIKYSCTSANVNLNFLSMYTFPDCMRYWYQLLPNMALKSHSVCMQSVSKPIISLNFRLLT
jgi:hypothetical protein